MNSIILKGRAKINLTLDVVGKRENGYHDLQMIMQSISLYDTLYIRKIKAQGVRLSSNYAWLPTNEKNIAYRAAELFFEETGIQGGVAIEITKRIPVGAGLAGGSTDAAATLIGLNKLFGTKLTKASLMEIGLKLGADVPFCILKGTALAEGIGEELTPLSPMPYVPLVIVKPPFSVSTAAVYKNLDYKSLEKHPNTPQMIKHIENGNIQAIANEMVNVLETVTIPMHPVIEEIKAKLMKEGALGAMMSGSGSAVFGIFETKEAAVRAANYFKMNCNYREVYITSTYANGLNRKDTEEK
ncbi:4-(cytidine 5'-diphospho)-2-C-methyl-D-erythritol kinase [Sporanaerobium hydrogeniformans]|uniref:4-(Cytidine 5'-diphospho)-2-C-methyl-D-erythritol kinase n=1 Tax=Sporanaerobium hydrogeniformans TaxID=3072179 RepID=A0AC61D9J3_9FIRM|nr:4-(cytidine 5'-diphospho)-2-C-methyl-D-erythritol kinase [Sporanaerobium hydrogeniformans]PHV69373.1 4-(cytidine 5'-diphospho)-2-C-methyl-D-erythritol kinase [Sporanaerobium hydrogeniformans]